MVRSYIFKLLTLISVLTISGSCERRPLEEGLAQTALIPVKIDWSISGVNEEDMHRASIWLFPKDKSAPLEYRIEGNLNYTEIAVPIGEYSVLIFNETVDQSDWVSIEFKGQSEFDTFAAFSMPVTPRGFYTGTEAMPLIDSPDQLAGWSLNDFTVTRDMVLFTRSYTKNETTNSAQLTMLNNATKALMNVQPTPRIENIEIKAKVKNLSSSVQATGILEGNVRGVYMANGSKVGALAAHPIFFKDRVYESNGKDGLTSIMFTAFGRLPGESFICTIDFILIDGTEYTTGRLNVDNRTIVSTEHVVTRHMINIGISGLTNDPPVELPDQGGLDTGIGVGGWDEVIIPLQ